MAVNLGTLRDSLPFNDGKTAVKIRVSSRAKGGTQLLQRILKHISDTSIEVGFFDEKNAAKAYLMEKGGVSDGFIKGKVVPKRPFMRRALEAKKDKAHKLIKEAISEAFSTRRVGGIDRAFNEVGEILVEEIRKKIKNLPNLSSTDKKFIAAPITILLTETPYTTEVSEFFRFDQHYNRQT